MQYCAVVSDFMLQRHAKVLFELDQENRIVRINESNPEEQAPAVFFARGKLSNLLLTRADVPFGLSIELQELASQIEVWHEGQSDVKLLLPLIERIESWNSLSKVSHGVSFEFNSHSTKIDIGECVRIKSENSDLLTRFFPYTRSVLAERDPVVAIARGGVAVASCYSARKSDTAAEAGVATLENYRGLGLGPAVVAAWAEEVRRLEAVPLYSTTWSNEASLKVAAKLGLEAYAETFSLT